MKISLITLTLLLASPALNAQVWAQEKKYRNHRTAEGLRGAARTLTESRYQWPMPQGDSGRPRLDYFKVYTYTAAGNMAEERLFRKDSSLARVELYSYDTQGRLSQRVGYYPDQRPKSETTTRYEYDAQGNLAREVLTLYPDRLLAVTTFRYDRAGRRIEKLRKSLPDVRKELRLYTYDREGRLQSERTTGVPQTTFKTFRYPAPGKVETHYVYERPSVPGERIERDGLEELDAHGNMRRTEYDRAPGEPRYVYSYDLNQKGDWVRQYVADERTPHRRFLVGARTIVYDPQP